MASFAMCANCNCNEEDYGIYHCEGCGKFYCDACCKKVPHLCPDKPCPEDCGDIEDHNIRARLFDNRCDHCHAKIEVLYKKCWFYYDTPYCPHCKEEVTGDPYKITKNVCPFCKKFNDIMGSINK